MYVVNIGLDPKTLDPESVVAFRNRAYGKLTDHYSIVVPSPATVVVNLSDTTTVYGMSGIHKAVQLLRMFWKTRALIRAGRCDVVTTQDMYYLGLLGVYFSRRYHLGFEVQVLGIEKLSPLRKRIALFVLRRAGVIRALSPRLRDRLIHEFGIPEEKITVVSIYVDAHKLGLDVRTLTGDDARSYEELVKSFRETYGAYFNFLTVSRLVPIKQIELQLEALKNLTATDKNIRLHIVGQGPHEGILKERVRALALTDYVIFHGYQSGYALGAFYLECDCFLLTSDYEGWGMVIVEAATAGIPIIMTDVGCAGELIVDGESGLVIPVRNVDAIKVAMERVVRDAVLRDTLSVGATRALASLPSFETLLGEYKKNWELAWERRVQR